MSSMQGSMRLMLMVPLLVTSFGATAQQKEPWIKTGMQVSAAQTRYLGVTQRPLPAYPARVFINKGVGYGLGGFAQAPIYRPVSLRLSGNAAWLNNAVKNEFRLQSGEFGNQIEVQTLRTLAIQAQLECVINLTKQDRGPYAAAGAQLTHTFRKQVNQLMKPNGFGGTFAFGFHSRNPDFCLIPELRYQLGTSELALPKDVPPLRNRRALLRNELALVIRFQLHKQTAEITE